VLLIAPDSPFSQAETELKLTDSLRRTGHSVRRVASEAELETALHQEGADVVVVYWTDAGTVNDRLAAATSGAPTVVPVVYHATASQLSDATAQSRCVAQVEKRRGRPVGRNGRACGREAQERSTARLHGGARHRSVHLIAAPPGLHRLFSVSSRDLQAGRDPFS
jgi:hypothetical protein